jgi:hypothetical protein
LKYGGGRIGRVSSSGILYTRECPSSFSLWVARTCFLTCNQETIKQGKLTTETGFVRLVVSGWRESEGMRPSGR